MSSRVARSAPRPASTPAARPRTSSWSATTQTEKTIWWEKNGKLSPQQFDVLLADFLEHAKGKQLYAQDLYGGADPKYRIKARVFTELAWHSLFIRSLLIRPERKELARLRARLHHPLPADLQGRSEAARRAQRDRDRAEPDQAHDPDRRQLLCRRDEEVGVHDAELLPAGRKRDADALLGECRQGRRRRAVLRPVRHRQDHALGRSEPHADRRRRARLGPARRVQFRGRLLRQDHQAVARGRAGDLRRDAALRLGAGECRLRPGDAHRSTSTTSSKTENTRSAYPLDFIPNASRTGPRRHAEEPRDADRRRVRRDAADRQAHARAGDVSLPLRLHRQGRRHREGPRRRASRNSPPASARRSCRVIRPSTATCCAS